MVRVGKCILVDIPKLRGVGGGIEPMPDQTFKERIQEVYNSALDNYVRKSAIGLVQRAYDKGELEEEFAINVLEELKEIKNLGENGAWIGLILEDRVKDKYEAGLISERDYRKFMDSIHGHF
jgi:hypothetical protein